MRKVFTFLASVFVCALVATGAPAQAQGNNSKAQSDAFASANASILSSVEIAQQIAAAKQLLKLHSLSSNDTIGIATLDRNNSQVNIFSVNKDSFLTKGASITATTQLGRTVLMHVIRPNGVNTAMTVVDAASGQQLLPLVVQYPIVKSGSLTEIAYYTSAHPALLSADIVSAGNAYVTSMIENAAERLSENGVNIADGLVQIAEHLVIVEHTDHQRFLNDDRSKIYPDILSLYALNQGDTFRYSVSSAGAGGMIQMIPRTYDAIRQQHPGISLVSDFVSGMRDHANALEAMLLYLNDTWSYLQKQEEVQNALRDGIATKTELLAAGYNSNPMRLPAYLKNGGTGWRTLIPAETQLYLSIYSSVDGNVSFSAPTPANIAVAESSSNALPMSTSNPVALLISWVGQELETKARVVLNDLGR